MFLYCSFLYCSILIVYYLDNYLFKSCKYILLNQNLIIMSDKELVLIPKSIKALSVESRVSILKQLGLKKSTLSELSEKLKISKPSVKEHLAILDDAGLIRKIPSENIWIYYELTDSGKSVIKPEGVKVLFMFAFSALATIFIGIYLLFSSSIFTAATSNELYSAKAVSDIVATESAPMLTASISAEPAVSIMQNGFPYIWAIFFVLLILTVVLFIMYLKKRKNINAI